MLTPEQVQGLQVAFDKLSEPLVNTLISDIARRVSEAGQLTSTAAYEIWRAQNLGKSREFVEKAVADWLGKSVPEVQELFKQAAEVGYNFDVSRLPVEAIPFAENESIQQIVQSAVNLADEELKNITQTLGVVQKNGVFSSLTDYYRQASDEAFLQVSTGVLDYNTAIRRACSALAQRGIQTIHYESGVRTSLEAAVRRNMMGGLGLMVEDITKKNHDDLGCDGWEISAHAASAPDHEPIQGRQYADAEYERLNNSLVRRIETLNCGHTAIGIIIGVSEPQYTKAELEKFREDNAKGVDYEGKHFNTVYEATQYQRRMERAIRAQKRDVLIAENQPDKEALQNQQIRLQALKQRYQDFCRKTGLRTEDERLFVSGFGRKGAGQTGDRHGRKWYNKNVQNEKGRTGAASSRLVLSSGKTGDTDGASVIESVEEFIFSDREAIEREIDRFAQEFAYASEEHAVVFSPQNRLYRISGQTASVNVDLAGEDALNGAIVIHNHPVPLGESFYDSFSRQDFVSTAKAETLEEWLISGEQKHYLRINGRISEQEAQEMYESAQTIVFEKAFETSIPVEYEQLETMREIARMDERVIFDELRK